MSETAENAMTRLAHVLFLDIVGYSKLATDEQKHVSTRLKDIVRATPQVSRSPGEDHLISLSTGDGMALAFFDTPISPVECAVATSKALAGEDFEVRMGVHSGLVQLVVDVNDKLNIAGDGINTAQRVMDCGDGGHILVSRRVADDLSQIRKWQPMLHDLGTSAVKHDAIVHLVNLHSPDVGNPATPSKLQKQGLKKRSGLIRNLAIAGVVLAAIAVALFLLRPAWLTGPASPEATKLRPEAEFTAILDRKKDAWVDRVFATQAPSGGIKASPSDRDITHQTWSTAQCLVGVFEARTKVAANSARIKKAFEYIESERRTSPVEGWSLYGNEKDVYTVTEIAAWVTIANIKSLDPAIAIWSDNEKQQAVARVERDLASIVKRQSGDGGFRPIIDEDPEYSRTYSSVVALWALVEARRSSEVNARIGSRYDENIRRAVNWFMRTYKEGLGWVQNPNRMGQTARFDGLTAQTLFALAHAAEIDAFAYVRNEHIYKLAQREFIGNKQFAGWSVGKDNSSVPDGDLRFLGTEFLAEGSTFLWFPWVLVELAELSTDETLPGEMRTAATELRLQILNANHAELENYVEIANFSYILAENLFAASHYVRQTKQD